jgi:hypothetical protein
MFPCGKIKGLVILGMITTLGGPALAQRADGPAPREDTLHVTGGNWIQLDREVRFIERDTYFVLDPATNFEVVNTARSKLFYDSLEARLRRHKLTDKLHDLLIRRPKNRPVDDESELIQQTRTAFIPYTGKTIGRIVFQRVDLFDGSVEDTARTARSWTGRTLNFLHIHTRQPVIARYLLFSAGDAVDPDRMADSERLLRSLSYIEDARIYLAPLADDPRQVEVRVVTKDRFSLGVDASMGGLGKFRSGVYNKNFLGMGMEMGHQFLYNQNHQSPGGYHGWLRFDHIGRHLVTTDIDYINTSEVDELSVRFDRGFFTPQARYAGGFRLANTRRLPAQLSSEGPLSDNLYRARLFDFWGGRSFEIHGLKRRSEITASVRYSGIAFPERPENIDRTDNLFYHQRRLLLANLSLISRRFYRSRNFSGFGDTEDIPIGISAGITGGYDFGEFFRRPYAGAEIAGSWWVNGIGYFGLQSTLAGFLRDEHWEDGLLRLHGRYFTPLLRFRQFRFRQLVEVEYTQGLRRLTPDDYLSFRKSLRNFPNDLPNGQNRLTFSLESILFAPGDFYGFKAAFFAFSDFGYPRNH